MIAKRSYKLEFEKERINGQGGESDPDGTRTSVRSGKRKWPHLRRGGAAKGSWFSLLFIALVDAVSEAVNKGVMKGAADDLNISQWSPNKVH